mgnify:CR=1 FL=1
MGLYVPPHRGGSLTLVSESGLYTMILRSDSAIKEGTTAFGFRVWVTDDLLPTLHKTGSYSCPVATITPSQQLRLREAVAKSAQSLLITRRSTVPYTRGSKSPVTAIFSQKTLRPLSSLSKRLIFEYPK